MAKYKVYYSGFAYVEADDEERARDYYDYDYDYKEEQIDDVEEVDELYVEL